MLGYKPKVTHLRDGALPDKILRWRRPAIVNRAASIQAKNMGNVEMAEGTIKKLIDKGFGFIKTGGDKRPVFPLIERQGVSSRNCKWPKGVLHGRPESERPMCRERQADLAGYFARAGAPAR